jgi:hypothetical protein
MNDIASAIAFMAINYPPPTKGVRDDPHYFARPLCPKRGALELLLLIQVRADARGIRANRDHPAAVFASHKSAPGLRSQAIRLGLFLLL